MAVNINVIVQTEDEVEVRTIQHCNSSLSLLLVGLSYARRRGYGRHRAKEDAISIVNTVSKR